MKEWFKSLFSDEGGVSAMRLFFICAFFFFYPAFCAVWIYTSIKAEELKDIPQGVIWLIGTLLVGKIIQKGVEVENKSVG